MGVIEVVKKQKEEQLLKQGRQEGIQEGIQQVVEGLILKKLGLSDEEIADIAKVNVDVVKKIRKDLSK